MQSPSGQLRARLRRARAFERAPAGHLDHVVRMAVVRSHRAGERLWSRGEVSEQLPIVLSGVFALQHPDGARARSTVALVGPGASPWNAHMLERAPRLFDAIVLSAKLEAAYLPASVVSKWAASDPAFARIVLDAMSEHCSLLQAKLGVLAAGRVEARIAAFLIDLADRFGRGGVERAMTLEVPLPRELIAEYVSARPETVSRVLGSWRRAGIVHLGVASVELLQPERLRGLARPEAGERDPAEPARWRLARAARSSRGDTI